MLERHLSKQMYALPHQAAIYRKDGLYTVFVSPYIRGRLGKDIDSLIGQLQDYIVYM